MMRSSGIMRSFVVAMIVVLLFSGAPVIRADNTIGPVDSIGYEFNRDGNLEGWLSYNNGITGGKVEDGALQFVTNDFDANWYAPSPLMLRTTPDQSITFRMKSTNGSSVAIYFDTDTYPGLAEYKRLVVPIKADGEYHEYSINPAVNPYWKGIVQKLRMDLEPYDSKGAQVSIDYFRIGVKAAYGFEFNGSTEGWSSVQGLSELQAEAATVSATVYGPNPVLSSGPIDQPAEKLGVMKIRTRISGKPASSMTVSFTTYESPDFTNEQQMSIPVTSDGTFQEYTVPLWEHPSWNGIIHNLRLSLDGGAPGAGAAWEIDYIRFQSVALPSFGWDADGDAQGWLPLNDLTPFEVKGGVLSTKVTGSDPYLANESLEGIIGERDKTLTVRMSATAGNYVSVFFATDQAPSYAETRRIDFTITADGQMHDYTIPVGDHPAWKGRIIKLRLDLEGGDRTNAVMAFDDVRFISSPAGADLNVKRSKPALHVGEVAEISADIRNTGGKAFFNPQAELVVSDGLKIISGSSSLPLQDLVPGAAATATWTVQATTESPSQADVKLHAAGYGQSYSVALPALKPATAAPAPQSKIAAAYVSPDSGDAVLQNGHTRIIAPKSSFGYGQYQVYTWDDAQGWQLMASVQPFAAAVVKQGEHIAETVSFHPKTVTAGSNDGKAQLHFEGESSDSSGRQWMYNFDFSLGTDDFQVQTKQNVRADRSAELLNLIGPVLTVGEGSFGNKKDEALFPGLEWLVGDESSSSQLDVHTPAYLRTIPHPYKITVPLMAVRQGNHIVSLSWDPKQKWDGVHDLPAAKFVSPNWVENQNNHVMGLSALSVPDYRKENQELAENAYPLPANQSLVLEAGITTAEAQSVSEAVNLYMKNGGLPEAPEVRPFEEQVDLGLDAYLRTYWDPQTKGWRHVNIYSWGTDQFPADIASLKMLGMAQPSRKAEVDGVISQALSAMTDKKKLGAPDYHIPQFQAPFFVGYLDEAMSGLDEEMKKLMDTQNASGAWLYDKEGVYNPPLGPNGSPLLGSTALNAKQLLKYAAMTGNAQAKEAGLKGLAAVESMGNVPRAGQPWEVPLHTPDIVAAAHMVGAYVQAYKLTGDKKYLDKAVAWAKTGLPFVYTWGVDDRPMMQFGTIPIFGASAYINPWFATPVQWNGLVYAYDLLELTDYDQSGPWKQVAEGILASAEIQQASGKDETWRGGYPDNWKLISNSRSDTVMLNPEEIVKTALMKRYVEQKGPKPDIQSVSIPGCPNGAKQNCPDTKITSLANVKDSSPSNTQHLVSFDLTYPVGETTYVLVAQREQPRKITVNDVELLQQDDLTQAKSGWSYSDDKRYLYIKVEHSGLDHVKIHY